MKDEVVRDWLDKLKHISYDMEDVLDEWKTAMIKLQMRRVENALLISKKKMHDIVHDLAQFVNRNECVSIEISDPKSSLISISFQNARHLTLEFNYSHSLSDFILSAQKLHSLLIDDWSETCPPVLGKVFDSLAYLRALRIFGNDGFLEIPKGIKNLIYLRYFSLFRLRIKELPEACCDLYDLQTLAISFRFGLIKLPEKVHKLVSLRRLLLGSSRLDYMPKGIEKLTGLRSLNRFIVSSDGQYGGKGCNIGSLKHLNHLRGSLMIQGLGNVTDVEEARKVELEKKKNLSDLHLTFDKNEESTWESEIEVDNEAIIEALRLTPNLEKLQIDGYRGNVLPNWLSSLTNIKDLSLVRFYNGKNVPFLGKLQSLESILIDRMKSVKRVSYEFFGIKSDPVASSSLSSPVIAFPKLKYLEFSSMDEWEEWDFGITSSGKEDIIIMPHLNHLKIYQCPKLKALPDRLF
ncbi:NB-ARC domain-containing disease resistance protein [Melia azedarach]|uniref:NB-ARC domain-containing disease resistance protein n=1 Tax=Melia azedarach TaxID=155640 RepID=A0ACC1Y6M8_MELAZ|nr:NB-ARC domain-containing disease resistance protein [Melia azedarach]